MPSLAEVTAQAEELAPEDQACLIKHLIEAHPLPFKNVTDEEVARREAELDSGEVDMISHQELKDYVLGQR